MIEKGKSGPPTMPDRPGDKGKEKSGSQDGPPSAAVDQLGRDERQATAPVRQWAALANAAIARNANAVIIMDADMRVRFRNRAFERMVRGGDEVRLPHLCPPADVAKSLSDLLTNGLGEKGRWTGQAYLGMPSGAVRTVTLDVVRIGKAEDDDRLYLCAIAAQGEREREREHLDYIAHHDILTGLPNRSMFATLCEQRLHEARISGTTVAVLFVDLDRFKRINDTLGHGFGDSLLAKVADKLASLCAEEDVVARLGGDEFALLTSGKDAEARGSLLADSMIDSLREPFSIEGVEIYCTASVGVTFGPRQGETAEELLRFADSAMYQAKRAGRARRARFDPDVEKAEARKLHIATNIMRALSRGELSLDYQPMRNLDTGEVVAFEALLRWQDADGEDVSPKEFIPIAEETGVMHEIGLWSLDEGLSRIGRFTAVGKGVGLIVNMTARQLSHGDIVDGIAGELARNGVAPDRLTIDVAGMAPTEKSDVLFFEHARRLSDMGVRITLDDFGVGYSSLEKIRMARVRAIKIDASCLDQPGGDVMLEAIAGMAKRMGLELIASGVETRRQAQFLREIGCLKAQGFFLGVPGRGTDAEAVGGRA